MFVMMVVFDLEENVSPSKEPSMSIQLVMIVLLFLVLVVEDWVSQLNGFKTTS